MKRHAKDELAKRIFKLISDQIFNYEREFDVSIQWQCDLKMNGKDYFDYKTGPKNHTFY